MKTIIFGFLVLILTGCGSFSLKAGAVKTEKITIEDIDIETDGVKKEL